MEAREDQTLEFHLKEVLEGRRRFETAAQAVYRMIMECGVEKVIKGGLPTYDYKFFRQGKRHIIGWYDEINTIVNFIANAASGGDCSRMALVLISEPGSGKTFFIQYLCDHYRRFCRRPENQRYTIQFVNLDKLVDIIEEPVFGEDEVKYIRKAVRKYGNITTIESQTFEDPVIFAMNLFGGTGGEKEWLAKFGFDDDTIDNFYRFYRPLGACTEAIWNDIRQHCDGKIEEMLKFVRIVPVRVVESEGILTGKYSAKDKITSSADDLLGKKDTTRILHLRNTSHPYIYNVRLGALARVAGGGIHFADELFRNKTDLVQIYLQVIENRNIELDGRRWPIDCLILATSNNDVFNEFVREGREAPIKDRCLPVFVAHNTDYKLQFSLTSYATQETEKSMITEKIHEDPNYKPLLSVFVTLTRLPHSDKLEPLEMMKLEAGETAGEKSIKTLVEIKKTLNTSQDVSRRWGQKGIGYRGMARINARVLAMPETHEGGCKLARFIFEAAEQEINDYVPEAVDREKYLKDLGIAKKWYKDYIKVSIYNAYQEDTEALRKAVLAYVNMIIGIGSEHLGPDKIWRYRHPVTGEMVPIKIDESYINAVEERLGLRTNEAKEAFRNQIRKIHGQKMMTDPNYDFMDNESLVNAVTEVRLETDVAGAGSLIGALTNLTNEENIRLRNRMLAMMVEKMGYCETCALATIEEYCKKDTKS